MNLNPPKKNTCKEVTKSCTKKLSNDPQKKKKKKKKKKNQTTYYNLHFGLIYKKKAIWMQTKLRLIPVLSGS
jgi:hypothetical protein